MMHRPIKFRIWDKLTKKLIDNKSVKLFPMDAYVEPLMSFPEPNLFGHYELMQFTGLYDIEGKEIYEGDIVKDFTIYSDLWPIKGITEDNRVLINLKVVWNNEESKFQVMGELDKHISEHTYVDELWGRDFKVIGNIYENRGLLNA